MKRTWKTETSILGRLLLISPVVVLGACSGSEDAGPIATLSSAITQTSGCQIDSAASVSLRLPAEIAPDAAVLVASGRIHVADRARVVKEDGAGAGVHNVGSSPGTTNDVTEIGVSGRVGSIESRPSVFLRNNAVVQGDLLTGGTLTAQGGEDVQGAVTQRAAIAPPQQLLWIPTFDGAAGGNLDLMNGASAAPAAGQYGRVHVFSGSTLTLRSGAYRMASLELESGSTLQIDAASGPVLVYADQLLTWRGTVTGSDVERNLLVVYRGTGFTGFDTALRGTLVAPNASVRLGVGGGRHRGAIIARDVELDPDVELVHIPFAHWDLALNRTPVELGEPWQPACSQDVCCPADFPVGFLDDADNILATTDAPICLVAEEGSDTVTVSDQASSGRVAILGGAGDDVLAGAAGDDILSGDAGNDVLLAGGGNDSLFGGEGDDFLCAGDGDDTVSGGFGHDTIQAGAGNDTIAPGPGRATIDAGAGDDTVLFYAACELEHLAGSAVNPGPGVDKLVSPVDAATLSTLGLDPSSFEVIEVASDVCKSPCAALSAPTSDIEVDFDAGTVTASGELVCTDEDVFVEIWRDDGEWEVIGVSPAPHSVTVLPDGARVYAWSLTTQLPVGETYFSTSGPGNASVRLRSRTPSRPQPSEDFETACNDTFACCGSDDDVWQRTRSRELRDQPMGDEHELANLLQGVAHDDDHWFFSKSGEEGDTSGDEASGLWAVPLTSGLGDFAQHTRRINPWGSRSFKHPGGMDYHEGKLFVALQGAKGKWLGVIDGAAVLGFNSQTSVGPLVCNPEDTVCQAEVVVNGTSHTAWAYRVTQASDDDTMAWVAVDPRPVTCEGAAPGCAHVYTIPFMDLESHADSPVFIDVYEWAEGQPLNRIRQLPVLGSDDRILTARELGNGRYQGGDISDAGKLYLTSDGESTDDIDINRDSASDNAIPIVDLPDLGEVSAGACSPISPSPDACPRFSGTHRLNINGDGDGFGIGRDSGTREELEGLTLWDLDGDPRAPDGIRGQIHALLVDVDIGTDQWYFKHLRLEPGCQSGSMTFWEGNDITEDQVCRLTVRDEEIDFQEDDYSCENDEARSATLRFLVPGTVVRFMNSPDCNRSFDYSELVVKRGVFFERLNTFEQNIDNDAFSLTYHRDDGDLDGKLSCVQMEVP